MEAVRASETSVYSKETTWRYIPEGSHLQQICQSKVSRRNNKLLLITLDIVWCLQCRLKLISCYCQKMPCNPATIRNEQTVWRFLYGIWWAKVSDLCSKQTAVPKRIMFCYISHVKWNEPGRCTAAGVQVTARWFRTCKGVTTVSRVDMGNET
jgi:hypothetical protein